MHGTPSRFLAHEGRRVGVDTRRLAVGGDSAGGTLAAVCAILARDAGLPLALQMLIYPGMTAHQDTASHLRHVNGPLLTKAMIDFFFAQYVRTPADRDDWRFAPLLADDVDGVAPAWIGLAECDPVVDDGIAYADKLRAARRGGRSGNLPGRDPRIHQDGPGDTRRRCRRRTMRPGRCARPCGLERRRARLPLRARFGHGGRTGGAPAQPCHIKPADRRRRGASAFLRRTFCCSPGCAPNFSTPCIWSSARASSRLLLRGACDCAGRSGGHGGRRACCASKEFRPAAVAMCASTCCRSPMTGRSWARGTTNVDFNAPMRAALGPFARRRRAVAVGRPRCVDAGIGRQRGG